MIFALSHEWTGVAGGPAGVAHAGVVVETGFADLDGGTAAAVSSNPDGVGLARRTVETPGNQWIEVRVSGLGPQTFELYGQMAGLDFACVAARVEFNGTTTVTGRVLGYSGAGVASAAVSGTVTANAGTVIPLRFEADADGAHRLIIDGTTVAERTDATVTGNYVGFGIYGTGRVISAEGGAREAPPELTGARIQRWADLAHWAGPVDLDAGLAGLAESDMTDNALRAMSDVAFAEGLGALYVHADGTLTFRQRDAAVTDPRQNTAQATFTDRDGDPAGACYSDVRPAVDETLVYNEGQIGSKGQRVQTSRDPESVAWFGPRTLARTLELEEWNDNLAVAILAVYTHADNERRVDEIVVRADDHLDDERWATACHLQLLDRVRVVRHFPGGYELDEDLIVQGVRHRLEGGGLGPVPAVWEVAYRTSSAVPFGDVGFGHWDVDEWDTGRWSL